MDFGLSEEQRLIAQSLQGFLAERLDVEELRRFAAQPTGFDAGIWQGLVELGLPGLLIAEEFGGSGLGALDAAVLAEEIGRAAAPVSYLSPIILAPAALAAAGSADQQRQWLPGIAAGEVRFAIAATALDGSTGSADLALDGDRLSGRITGILDAGGATHLLCFLANSRAAIAAIDADGLSLAHQPSLDPGRPLATAEFADVAVELLSAANDAIEAATRVLDLGRVMLAADTVGAGQAMLDQTIAYTADRVQFARPVAGFQALKHVCAEVVAMLEPCRALVWYAAHAQAEVPEEARLTACQAKAHTGDVGREIARMTTESHGGMGFTDLLGLHFWFKRIGFNRQVLGAPERCRQEAAQIQGWAA